jgi:glutathione synthase/RimK-type ligase-like ATP-grasp enzyme
MELNDCCILNSGGGSWAFETLAQELSKALWVDVTEIPRQFNYLLLADDAVITTIPALFIPFASLEIAADKRLLATRFATNGVPTPETHLVDALDEARVFLNGHGARQWCLKYPTGCGASGHRMLTADMQLPDSWPRPLIVQEFVPMERPEVYRLYSAGGQLFGWVAKRFPAGAKVSPWVAHVRGARYELGGGAPSEAVAASRAALEATGLLDSFGCVDLIQHQDGRWLVLEVGTDGLFNHVDRDLGISTLEQEIQRRIANAFWARLGSWRPWGEGAWYPRSVEEA